MAKSASFNNVRVRTSNPNRLTQIASNLKTSLGVIASVNEEITSNMTQARYDPNYRNIYVFEREYSAPSNRFILKNASNKTIKHITGATQRKIPDHITSLSKSTRLIEIIAKNISVPIIKTPKM